MDQALVYLSEANYSLPSDCEEYHAPHGLDLKCPVEYKIIFDDGSSCVVVLTRQKRNHLPYSKFNIDRICGQGYRKLKL